MKIYRLYTKNNNNKFIVYENTPLFSNIGELDWNNCEAIQSFSFEWSDNGDDISKAPFIINSIPVFSVELMATLSKLLDETIIKTIPISVHGEHYTILLANNIIEGQLNERKSKIERFSSGKIMDISKYVFRNNDNYPDIFKIKEFPVFTFVTDNIANILFKMNIPDLIIEECQTSNNIFF